MKINELTQSQQAATTVVKDARAAEKVQPEAQRQAQVPPEAQEQDKVELSSVAKDLQLAGEVAKATPDVRAEKVAAAKEKIDSGRYEVNSKEVATKMVMDSLSKLT